PYQTFRTATKDIALAVGSEKLWKAFCPAIGHPELVDHPQYRTNKERTQNFDQLINLLQEIFLTQSYDYWEEQLMAHGIPFGAVNDLSQVVEHPQVKDRKSTRLNSSHVKISYAVFCLKKKSVCCRSNGSGLAVV